MGDLVALIAIGTAIGILLGSVGGGGALVAVPALVYIGDQSVRGAQAGALVAVIAAAAIGFAFYLRRGDVRWRAGLVLGAAAGVSSLAGSILSRQLDPDVLLLAFVPVMVAGAWAMASQRAPEESTFVPWRFGVGADSALRVAALGLAVGWITGLFGVGGGFVIVPVLVVALGFAVREAVGTSLLIVAIGSAVALVDRLHGGGTDWVTIAPFAAAAVLGVGIGTALGRRVPGEALARVFAAIVVVTAIYTGAQSLLALL